MCTSIYAPIGTMPVIECRRRRTKCRRSRSIAATPPVTAVSIAMPSVYVPVAAATNQYASRHPLALLLTCFRSISSAVDTRRPSARLSATGDDLVHRLDELLDMAHRDAELLLLVVGERDLDHLLDAAGADLHRHADVDATHAVLAVQVRGARQDAALVEEVGLRHLHGGAGRRVEGRAGLQEIDDLAARLPHPILDGVQALGLDQFLDRDAADAAVATHRHHVVAVAAEDERLDARHGNAELHRDE